MNKEQFINELKKIGIILSDYQLELLDKYYRLLIIENQKMNLTAITDYNQVLLKHFYDSLTITKAIKLTNQKLCDIGTGAGFPGIVLKIVYPNLQITLVESITKKCSFLNKIIKELDLKDIKVINQRAEEFSLSNIEYFDIVTSRAVARLNVLLELSSQSLKVGGYYVALKGNIEDEVNNLSNCLTKLNLSLESITTFNLPIDNSTRNIVKIKKESTTPKIYPRKYNEIKKKPL